MRHCKTEERKSLPAFIKCNIDYILLAGTIALGAVAGAVFKLDAVPYAVFKGSSSFLSLFTGSFGSLTLYVFAIFFCGTSAIGFISPFVLLVFGISFGGALSTVYQNGTLPYYLCEMPFMVLSSALLAALAKDNITLSVDLFRSSLYVPSGDISRRFHTFAVKCLLTLALCAALCMIYSLFLMIFSM